MMMSRRVVCQTLMTGLTVGLTVCACHAKEPLSLFEKSNLVAWCIVPFDASQRTPAQRAEMVQRLGIQRIAYDWREEHVPEFEAEILQYQARGLEFFAFWSWHPDFAELVKKHKIRPQFWITNPSPEADTQRRRLELACQQLRPLVRQTRELSCALGLYNHGGWGGEPENLVAVCESLRRTEQTDHVGIVYNLHHGHEHIADFQHALGQMLPYLFCLNLNGMNDEAKPKILPLGQGAHDRALLTTIARSGYSGPIGILDHRPDVDAYQSLRENLDGLEHLVRSIQP